MDCARLKHWNWAADFGKVFLGKYDYRYWNCFRVEPAGGVAPLESQWNNFDRLQRDTKMLHNTQRQTQPWNVGLPAGFTLRKRICVSLRRARPSSARLWPRCAGGAHVNWWWSAFCGQQ
jgi:hypothetical protein